MDGSNQLSTFANLENLSFNEEDDTSEQKTNSKSVSENIKRSLVVTPNTFSPSMDENFRSQKIKKRYYDFILMGS